jgi:hypothetical protein
MLVDIIDLKLSVGRGLWGNISPKLRAVCVNSAENLIYMYMYFDGEITEEEHEFCECVLDDVSSDFSFHEEMKFDMPEIRLDYPFKIPTIGEWIYYRYEDIPCLFKYPTLLFHSKIDNVLDEQNVNLELSTQRALLGSVPPKLRAVSVNSVENVIYVYMCFDGEISKKDHMLCESTINKIKADFSCPENTKHKDLKIEPSIIRLDYPHKVPFKGNVVFCRYEETPKHLL